MSTRRSLLRTLLLPCALATGAPLLTPGAATAADGCISQDFGDGSFCVGCVVGACWGATCYDAGDGATYSDGGCAPTPPPPSYA